MGMTIWRWSAGVGLGCAAIGALVLPFPAATPRSWSSFAPPPLAAEINKLTAAANEAHAAVRSYRATQALDRWTAASKVADTALVLIDRSVPNDVAAAVRASVAEQWLGLGTAVSAAHGQVFVYVDSASIERAGDAAGSRRVLEARRLVDVSFALPAATDGRRCVTLVRLRGLSPAHIGAMRSQSVIGVCGFFAAFGLPGREIQGWLAGTGYRFARRSDWSVARAPATDASSLYGLSEPAGRCLTGETANCLSALRAGGSNAALGPEPGSRLASVLDAALPPNTTLSGVAPASLGDAEGELLADAVRSVGAERFARFWGSSGAPDSAFLAAAGVGLDTWTQQWLTRTYGSAPQRPSARVRDFVWLAIAAPFALFVAARPRHRVLAERLFTARA